MEVVSTVIAILLVTGLTMIVSLRFPSSLRSWIVLGLLEYLACAAAQFVYTRYVYKGGDAILYAETGEWFARLLDANFDTAAPELAALLFHRPSMFDGVIYGGGGGNTGSMHAISGWLVWLCRGSAYAASTLVAGCAFLGTLGIYNALQEVSGEKDPKRLFVPCVFFPSVAFWSSALHKEAFGVMGIGLLLVAWRGVFTFRWLRVLVLGPLGFTLVFLFRAPILGPLALGLIAHFFLRRIQKTRGREAAVFGPAYVIGGFLVLTLAMIGFSRLAPSLGLEQLGSTVAQQQRVWAISPGTANFGVMEDTAEQSLGAQVLRLPLALFNALLRPQLFDVHNVTALISALEMTFLLFLIIRCIRMHGICGSIRRIQQSPFLMMCAIITVVGCAFVGLVTFNFGSLARYRVPFLPFYGALLTGLLPVTAKQKPAPKIAREVLLRRRLVQRRTAAAQVSDRIPTNN